MPQQEDVLFCQIAITNGLISEGDAKKVLAFCDKREREAGRRPPIGDVFTKHNLLQAQQVNKLYEAVRKRTGAPAGPQRGPARGPARGPIRPGSARGAVRGPGAARDGRRADGSAAAKGMDPQTLWMGIGGMLGIVVVLGILAWIVFIKSGSHAPTAGEKKSGVPSDVAADAVPDRKAPGSKSIPGKDLGPKDLPKDELQEVMTDIGDAKGLRVDDPKKGLERLEQRQKRIVTRGYAVPKALETAIAEMKAAAGAAPAADGEKLPAAEPEKPNAVPESAKEEKKEAGAKSAETPRADEAGDEDLEKAVLEGDAEK